MDETERRAGTIEVQNKVDKLCDHIDKYINQDRDFHNRVERMFVDHFGDLDPVEHKHHHTWTRTMIFERQARAEFLKKIKYEVIKNGILVLVGAVAMYVAVSVYHSAAKDLANAATNPPQRYEQSK